MVDLGGRGNYSSGPDPNEIAHQIAEACKEIKQLRRDLYGDPQIRQKGVFDRIERLEERLSDLQARYERERVESGALARIEDELDQLRLDYKIAIVYLKGLAGGVGTILVAVIVAVVVGILRYFTGGG